MLDLRSFITRAAAVLLVSFVQKVSTGNLYCRLLAMAFRGIRNQTSSPFLYKGCIHQQFS